MQMVMSLILTLLPCGSSCTPLMATPSLLSPSLTVLSRTLMPRAVGSRENRIKTAPAIMVTARRRPSFEWLRMKLRFFFFSEVAILPVLVGTRESSVILPQLLLLMNVAVRCGTYRERPEPAFDCTLGRTG